MSGEMCRPEMLEVVAGIDDERDLVGAEQLDQPQREFCAADSAGDGDVTRARPCQRNMSSSSGRMMSRAVCAAVFLREAAYQRNGRFFGGFAHHQRRGGGDRVGAIDHRDLQFAPVDVVTAAAVVQRSDAGAADRAADRAESPRPIHAVADDHTGAHTGAGENRVADCVGRTRRDLPASSNACSSPSCSMFDWSMPACAPTIPSR